MGTHNNKVLRCLAASRAGRIAVAAASVAIWTEAIGASFADDAPAPSAARLERITEFFNNEIATGNLPGAVVLIQQHGKPVYLKCFGVRDVVTKFPMISGHDLCAPFDDEAHYQPRCYVLIDAGTLSLSDPVSKFIPDFADVKVGVGSVAPRTPILKLCR